LLVLGYLAAVITPCEDRFLPREHQRAMLHAPSVHSDHKSIQPAQADQGEHKLVLRARCRCGCHRKTHSAWRSGAGDPAILPNPHATAFFPEAVTYPDLTPPRLPVAPRFGADHVPRFLS